MKRIGITGENGFIGTHLFNTLRLYPDKYEIVHFNKTFFKSDELLDKFVSQCDVIVHLAGMNRHSEPEVIYNTNVELAQKLVDSLQRIDSQKHVIFSSSLQEEKDNPYGKSKKEARLRLQKWANEYSGIFTGLIIPNVFGPFGNPFYNSVVATFSYQITHGEMPKIDVDGELKLIYIGELIEQILNVINLALSDHEYVVKHTSVCRVSEILNLLNTYKEEYSENGTIPTLANKFELNLFNTFRCYEDIRNKFPTEFKQHIDDRGAFCEIVRLNLGGQVSFSTTHPGITRGNHFHTRKIERFAVIKGEALIQLRRVGTSDIMDFYLSGDHPAFVDMPIWYTHNITNIGNTELITIFWINEFYNSKDPDTFFETV